MELKILDATASKEGNGAILKLQSGQELFVGNDVVNTPVSKYGLTPGKFAMMCAGGMFTLEFPGKLVAHKEGDEISNSDGEIIGTYKFDGLHIESDEKYGLPTIRLSVSNVQEMLAAAQFEGKADEIRLFGQLKNKVQVIPE